MYDINESMRDALRAIAWMQIKEDTDHEQVLALCMSIAQIELDLADRLEKEAS